MQTTESATRIGVSRLGHVGLYARDLEKLEDEDWIDVMAHVTSHYWHGSPMVATMLRREFAFGTQRR